MAKSGWVWSGWIIFAALTMMLIGGFNVLQGLAAIFSDNYYAVTEDKLLVLDFTAWGWITLIWGGVLLAVGGSLLAGKAWSRWAGVVIVMGNALAQAAFMQAFPLWSILVIALCAVVVYSLTVRWDEAQSDLEGSA